jgi:hypothetical protein
MKSDLLELVRNADPYPERVDIPFAPFVLRAGSFAARIPAAGRKHAHVRLAFAVLAVGAVTIGTMTFGRLNSEKTQQLSTQPKPEHFLLWPSYVPKGFCLASENRRLNSPEANIFRLRKGKEIIAISTFPAGTSFFPELIGKEVSVGSAKGVLTGSRLRWNLDGNTIFATGTNVKTETLIKAAESVTVRDLIPRASLPGFSVVPLETDYQERAMLSYAPCAHVSNGVRINQLVIATDKLGPVEERGLKTNRGPNVHVRRAGATEVASFSGADDDLHVSWSESEHAVTVDVPHGTGRKEAERIIASLEPVSIAEWERRSEQKDPILGTITLSGIKWQELLQIKPVAKTTFEGKHVCLSFEDNPVVYPFACSTPSSKPRFSSALMSLNGNLHFAVATSSIQRAVLVFPGGKTKEIPSALVKGFPAARVFVVERGETDPLAESIVFLGAKGKVVFQQSYLTSP